LSNVVGGRVSDGGRPTALSAECPRDVLGPYGED